MKRMIVLALAGLSGCATCHPAPLPDRAPVAAPLPATKPLTLA